MKIPRDVLSTFSRLKDDQELNEILRISTVNSDIYIFKTTKNGENSTLIVFEDGSGNWVDGVLADKLVSMAERIK